ncbi:MAG TPA: DUF2793 domain-containing protein [Rhizomicrobium sp.]|nr:DUF2793 domain-containing protein [Rhizomicrobium sp.]
MSDTTPRSALPLLAAAQAQKHVTHNEALLQLDALLFARFLDRDLTAPPSSPADGDTYLVHAGASGDWTGKDGEIAFASDGPGGSICRSPASPPSSSTKPASSSSPAAPGWITRAS